MMYPFGYGSAEHRRALDALLRDLAAGERTSEPKRRKGPRRRDVVRSAAASGSCQVELRFPEVRAIGA